MELAAVLQKNSLSLELHWAPRLQNKLADALSNGVYSAFDPQLRLRFNFEKYRSLVLHELMDLGSELYSKIKEHKAKLTTRKAAKLRKEERLRENDPWKPPSASVGVSLVSVRLASARMVPGKRLVCPWALTHTHFLVIRLKKD